MQASIQWQHGLSFTGTADTGFTVQLGASPKVGGDNDGFRPLELMLLSLAGCSGMDVMAILRKKRQQVTDFQVVVEAERSDNFPKVFTDIHLHMIVRGRDISTKAVESSIRLSKDYYCPASAMLSKAVPIRYTYEIVEA